MTILASLREGRMKRKEAKTELWQLKIGLIGVIGQLNEGVDHLDTLTCRTIGRALGELMQETISLPKSTPQEEIETWARDMLSGTDEMQQELADKWEDELQPLMERAHERALSLDHQLAEFTCLSVDGQEWGAICIKCLEWIFVRPEQTSGALLSKCTGWMVSWK
jgi:hypothetical protein